MAEKAFALKGNVVYSKDAQTLHCRDGAYLVCEGGKVQGVYGVLPQRYDGIPLHDKGDALIIPGLVDLHLHAPQYAFRGLGMDLELLDWLEQRTFPEEAKYSDEDYARRAYAQFVQGLVAGGTTRAAVFATVHLPATLMLMDMLEASGLVCQVGKVNMDRNSSAALQEDSAEASLQATRQWLQACKGRYHSTTPILTPRFVPSCSDALMQGLADIQKETGLAVQSHLSENKDEVAWVRQLCPDAETYADAYLCHGLFGGEGCPTIMAHCVYSEGREAALLQQQGVWVAHCPISNTSLSSGIAPVRAFLNRGIRVGLGTDIAGGYNPSVFGVMAAAVGDSKLRWRLVDDSLAPLSLPEAFYLATRGGGSFFGRVGAFEEGYAFDALVLDDEALPCSFGLTSEERLERVVYLGGDGCVAEKYVEGNRVK